MFCEIFILHFLIIIISDDRCGILIIFYIVKVIMLSKTVAVFIFIDLYIIIRGLV